MLICGIIGRFDKERQYRFVITRFRARHICGGICLSLLLSLALLSGPVEDAAAQSYYGRGDIFLKRFNVYGSLQLEYDRRWGTGSPAQTAFGQDYNLGVTGFVIDPRLLNFNVSGQFTDLSVTHASGYSLTAEYVTVNILEKLPPRLLKAWYVLPNPISLRFGHYSSSETDYTNYGVSVGYGMPDEIRAQKQQEKPESRPLFPTVYFDYDRYDVSGQGAKNVTDVYSLRAFLNGRTYDYRLYYDSLNQRGTTPLKQKIFNFEPDYHFYDERTGRTFDINTVFRLDNTNDRKFTYFFSRQSWLRSYGNDRLQITGNLNYQELDQDNAKSYNAFATTSYTKVFSPRLTNVTSLSLGYAKIENRDSPLTLLSDTAYYEISRLLRGVGGAFVGSDRGGVLYGLNASVSTKTLVTTTLQYILSSAGQDPGREIRQQFILDASGPLLSTLSFNTGAQYVIRDVSGVANPSNEKSLLFSANLFWYVLNTALSVGGTYTDTKTDLLGETTSASLTSLQATLARVLTQRLFFYVYSNWQKDSVSKTTQLDVRPRLTWATQLTTVDVEYDYRQNATSGYDSVSDHRVNIRFVRRFSKNFFLR